MSVIVWEDVPAIYYGGIFHCAVYGDGFALPWYGVTSVDIGQEYTEDKIWYDGELVSNTSRVRATSGSIESYNPIPGTTEIEPGVKLGSSELIPTGFVYNTLIRSPTSMQTEGRALTVVYNTTFVPETKSIVTDDENITPSMSRYKFTAVPEKTGDSTIPMSAYIELSSTKTSPGVIELVEKQLYGSVEEEIDAHLPTLENLVGLIRFWS